MKFGPRTGKPEPVWPEGGFVDNGRYIDFVKFAIDREREAAELYEKSAVKVQARSSRVLLTAMAEMERGHEAKLVALLATGKADFAVPGTVDNLHLSEYLVKPVLTDSSSIQDVFSFAIKAEEKAHALYARLAALEGDGDTRALFNALASEEMQHKNDLESEYERQFMAEN